MTTEIKPQAPLRPAAAADAKALSEFAARTFRDAFGAGTAKDDLEHYIRDNFSPAMWLSQITDARNAVFVAEEEDFLTGYVMLHPAKIPAGVTHIRSIQLKRIYVAEDKTGSGLSDHLMKCALTEARRRGYSGVWLSVWEKNKRAISFYTRWGFKPVGRMGFLMGDDLQKDLVLEKDVSGSIKRG